MQQSDNCAALLAEIEAPLAELEALCARLEDALMGRRWNDLGEAVAHSRRLTHALQNAMEDAAAVRDESFDRGVTRRLRRLQAIRQNQMERLAQYHDAVGERLQLIGRWKSALKAMARGGSNARVSALNQLT